MFSAIKVGLLLAEIDDDGRPALVPFGHMRSHEIAHGVIRAATAQAESKAGQRAERNQPICDYSWVRQTLHSMERFVLLLIVLGLLTGCVSDGPVFPRDNHEPVAGEATPPPQTGPRGGWAW
jgi:hypothetical protein